MHTCMKMWFRGVIPSKSLLNCIFVQTHPAEAYTLMSGWHAIIGEGHSGVLRNLWMNR